MGATCLCQGWTFSPPWNHSKKFAFVCKCFGTETFVKSSDVPFSWIQHGCFWWLSLKICNENEQCCGCIRFTLTISALCDWRIFVVSNLFCQHDHVTNHSVASLMSKCHGAMHRITFSVVQWSMFFDYHCYQLECGVLSLHCFAFWVVCSIWAHPFWSQWRFFPKASCFSHQAPENKTTNSWVLCHLISRQDHPCFQHFLLSLVTCCRRHKRFDMTAAWPP